VSYRTAIRLLFVTTVLVGVADTGRAQADLGIQVFAGPVTPHSPHDGSSLDAESTVQTHVDLVQIPVSVTDKRERNVTGLTKDDFRLLENNRLQLIHSVSREDEPSSIGIVLDLSNSMAAQIDRALLAIHALLANTNVGDEFFLITFSNQPRLAAGFTSSVEEIESILPAAKVGGHTALVDAIDFAIATMQEAKHSRRALVVVSDGGDNHSRHTLKHLERDVQEQDLLIFGVGLYDHSSATPEAILGSQLLTELSDKSGGAAFDGFDRRDIAQAASSIADQVHSRYLLTYYPAKKPDDGKWHATSVTLLGHNRKHLHVHAKTGYYGFQR
jgi:Ca-activated chloride channel homolog